MFPARQWGLVRRWFGVAPESASAGDDERADGNFCRESVLMAGVSRARPRPLGPGEGGERSPEPGSGEPGSGGNELTADGIGRFCRSEIGLRLRCDLVWIGRRYKKNVAAGAKCKRQCGCRSRSARSRGPPFRNPIGARQGPRLSGSLCREQAPVLDENDFLQRWNEISL